jgi:NADH:ubiquinone oxidoreductase subunit K
MGLSDLLPRRAWAVVISAVVVAGAALFVGPSVTGLSPLTHILVVGAVEAACALAILGTFFRYTAAEESKDEEEWQYDS